jgi:hypothetical protein
VHDQTELFGQRAHKKERKQDRGQEQAERRRRWKSNTVRVVAHRLLDGPHLDQPSLVHGAEDVQRVRGPLHGRNAVLALVNALELHADVVQQRQWYIERRSVMSVGQGL